MTRMANSTSYPERPGPATHSIPQKKPCTSRIASPCPNMAWAFELRTSGFQLITWGFEQADGPDEEGDARSLPNAALLTYGIISLDQPVPTSD